MVALIERRRGYGFGVRPPSKADPLIGMHAPNFHWWVWLQAPVMLVLAGINVWLARGWALRVEWSVIAAFWLTWIGSLLLQGRTAIDTDGVRVREAFRWTRVPWAEVAGVEGPERWDPHPWVKVTLAVGDTMALPRIGLDRLAELQAYAEQHGAGRHLPA